MTLTEDRVLHGTFPYYSGIFTTRTYTEMFRSAVVYERIKTLLIRSRRHAVHSSLQFSDGQCLITIKADTHYP